MIDVTETDPIVIVPADFERRPGSAAIRIAAKLPDGFILRYFVNHPEGDEISAGVCTDAGETLALSRSTYLTRKSGV